MKLKLMSFSLSRRNYNYPWVWWGYAVGRISTKEAGPSLPRNHQTMYHLHVCLSSVRPHISDQLPGSTACRFEYSVC
jgi:hypothetical protein